MRHFNRQSGFSILEIMVALAVVAILAAISTPNLSNWMRVYRLKSAAMDLYSNLQMAKMNAVKENRQWKLRFNSGGFYDAIRCLTVTCEAGNIAANINGPGDYQIIKPPLALHTIQFSEPRDKNGYNNEVEFKNPTSATVFDVANDKGLLILNANGLADITGSGYIYLSNKINSSYYRVGFLSIAAAVRIQKWNSSSSIWE